MKQYENIKYQISISIFIVFFLFLIFNSISSQVIPPLYFQFVSNNKQTTVNFLEKIKTFPEFIKILEMNKNIYGKTIEEETFRQENGKNLMINNLEQKLKINPKARDVIYGLYQLYLAKDDKNKANEYLRRAREVDPAIGL